MSKVAVIGIVGNSVFLPVEKFHVGGETIEAKSVTFELGGKGFNQAVAAKRWGAEVSFLAAAGRRRRGKHRKLFAQRGRKRRNREKERIYGIRGDRYG